MLKKCQHCGDDYAPYVGRQRFCCRACSDAWFARERKEGVRLLRESRESEVAAHDQ
jgi:hypothetical protein